MAAITHIPTDGNVSASAVGRMLGTAERTVSGLCTHKSINKWSMYKPIRSPRYGVLTARQRQQMFADADFGYAVPSFESARRAAKATVAQRAWTYNPPRTEAQYGDVFRLGDFRGYDHAAGDWFAQWSIVQESDGRYRVALPVPNTLGSVVALCGNMSTWSADLGNGSLSFGLLAYTTGTALYFLNFGNVATNGTSGTFYFTAPPALVGRTLHFIPAITSQTEGLGAPPEADGIDGGLTVSEWVDWSPVGDGALSSGTWWALPSPAVTLQLAAGGSHEWPTVPQFILCSLNLNNISTDFIAADPAYGGRDAFVVNTGRQELSIYGEHPAADFEAWYELTSARTTSATGTFARGEFCKGTIGKDEGQSRTNTNTELVVYNVYGDWTSGMEFVLSVYIKFGADTYLLQKTEFYPAW